MADWAAEQGSPAEVTPAAPKKPLTPKQQRFVEEYLVDLCASAAYKRAGYKARGNAAEVSACQLLRNPQVQAAIQAGMQKRSKRIEIDQDWVLENLRGVVARALQEEQIYGRDGKPTGEYRFDSSGANRALELVGRHLKMWDDDRPAVNVNINLTREERLERIRSLTDEARTAAPSRN
ncbi:MAG: terminase small subunit [Armatimonadetes bacterium]|nr:terminase small subunit [Armatimonadota bacterium]